MFSCSAVEAGKLTILLGTVAVILLLVFLPACLHPDTPGAWIFPTMKHAASKAITRWDTFRPPQWRVSITRIRYVRYAGSSAACRIADMSAVKWARRRPSAAHFQSLRAHRRLARQMPGCCEIHFRAAQPGRAPELPEGSFATSARTGAGTAGSRCNFAGSSAETPGTGPEVLELQTRGDDLHLECTACLRLLGSDRSVVARLNAKH